MPILDREVTMEGDAPSLITPTEPGWYWAVVRHWAQCRDNLRVVEVRIVDDQLVVDDADGFNPLDEYTFYSGPIVPPKIPPPAAWYRPETPP
jgi:hypothetical protein